MTVRLTDRDVRMLVKCGICRWLTTDQLKRLYFPETTLNAVQKRLRKLADEGYLRSHREHPTAEAIHALGPKGKPLVEQKGIEVTLQTEIPHQLTHLLGVNELRAALETSTAQIAWFFSYQDLVGLGWTYPVIPDAVFAIRTTERHTFLVEYDRNTETLRKLFEKLEWYDKGLMEFPVEAVLILTERTRQLDVLARGLRRKNISLTVLASTLEELREKGFLECVFVDLLGGQGRRVLEASTAEADA